MVLLIGGVACSSGYQLPGTTSGTISKPGPPNGGNSGVPGDGGSNGGGNDGGEDAGMVDSGCTPVQALNGCYSQGQACDLSLGALGGCISPLQCYSYFDDAGMPVSTCCDFSSGVPEC